MEEINGSMVTFVMPAFNVEAYIKDAVASLKRQSVADWRLVIVDDGSTDSTLAVAKELAQSDGRIRVVSMPEGSGSVYQPRKRAILEATTEWVSPLDADDWIEDDYLEKLLRLQKETQADIVYPVMWRPGAEGKPITELNPDLFVSVKKGRECVKLTLDGWNINCNGGLIRRGIYEEAFNKYDSSVRYSFADELLTRQLLSLAPAVAFSQAKYFYRPNEDSITRKKSVKLFHFLINNVALISFVKDIYGKDSEEYILAQRQNFHGYFEAVMLLGKYRFSEADRKEALRLMALSKSAMDLEVLKGNSSPRLRMLLPLNVNLLKLIFKLSGKKR